MCVRACAPATCLPAWLHSGCWQPLLLPPLALLAYSHTHHPTTLPWHACRDSSLRMWDLVKGRCTYTSKLEAEAEAVAFSREDGGARYALLAGSSLTLHSVAGEAGAPRPPACLGGWLAVLSARLPACPPGCLAGGLHCMEPVLACLQGRLAY